VASGGKLREVAKEGLSDCRTGADPCNQPPTEEVRPVKNKRYWHVVLFTYIDVNASLFCLQREENKRLYEWPDQKAYLTDY
jgi:hypothetical protein